MLWRCIVPKENIIFVMLPIWDQGVMALSLGVAGSIPVRSTILCHGLVAFDQFLRASFMGT